MKKGEKKNKDFILKVEEAKDLKANDDMNLLVTKFKKFIRNKKQP